MGIQQLTIGQQGDHKGLPYGFMAMVLIFIGEGFIPSLTCTGKSAKAKS